MDALFQINNNDWVGVGWGEGISLPCHVGVAADETVMLSLPKLIR